MQRNGNEDRVVEEFREVRICPGDRLDVAQHVLGLLIFQRVDDPPERSLQQSGRSALTEDGLEQRAVRTPGVLRDDTEERVPAGGAMRWTNQNHSPRARGAK